MSLQCPPCAFAVKRATVSEWLRFPMSLAFFTEENMHNPEALQNLSEPAVLTVPDLAEALEYFTNRLGFRLEMIVPADDPQAAVIFGQGLRLRLERGGQSGQGSEADTALLETLLVTRIEDGAGWHIGRAGMQYRDLVPSRLGGQFIASHICIPDGGVVSDYVHYHKVRFQLIFCKAGWVRVVYEDQGPPFVLQAGDCVLQPPEIRHRVLEASPGLEVIEVGSPAVHKTYVEHQIELPTAHVVPERVFRGQRFVRHVAREATWQPWRLTGFNARDTGIAAATDDLAAVQVIRALSAVPETALLAHTGELLFWFVLQGELTLAREADGAHALQPGDCCVIPAGKEYSIRAAAGLEWLEVRLPAFVRS